MRCWPGLVLALSLLTPFQTAQASFDVLIVNGRVSDGSGNPWRRADIGIRGDRIVAVGRLTGATATTVIDAKDRIVAPGFIDVHSHALSNITNPALRDARALIAQGVTTVVGNPDGGGARRPEGAGGEPRGRRWCGRQRGVAHRPRECPRRRDAPALRLRSGQAGGRRRSGG